LLEVVGVRPLEGYLLWLHFSNGEERIFDMEPLFEYPLFSRLRDPAVFASVYLDYGAPTWLKGEIDISPEKLYAEGTAVDHE
ncbi:MAG: DUF2442 domain-containing protein, partial [Eggerthellaceae bacterium]|nr:DUF2442 domain-containing protein [Eggerthellaceae bacterium]